MPCFSDIVGQQRAIQSIERSISAGRLAHAYLFSGPEGVGKRTTALALASALNCSSHPGKGCGSCTACVKVAHGNHPDVICIAPDGAFIKIGQIRALEPYLAIPPHEGAYRLIVIDGAEALHPSAANALLKSVEEPRSDTVFVLCTAAAHRVVGTLISRCRRVRFTPLAREQLLAVVEGRFPAGANDPTALQWATAVAEGSPGRALAMLSDESTAVARDLAQRLDRAAASQSALEIFDAAEGGRGADRSVVQQAAELLQVRLRDQLLLSAGLEPNRLVFDDSTSGSDSPAQQLGSRRILRQLRAVQDAQAALQGNANAVLTLETLTLALQQEVAR